MCFTFLHDKLLDYFCSLDSVQLLPVALYFSPSALSFKAACACVTQIFSACFHPWTAARVVFNCSRCIVGRDPSGQACTHGRPEKTSAPPTTSMPPNAHPSPPLQLHGELLWTDITCVRVPHRVPLHCHFRTWGKHFIHMCALLNEVLYWSSAITRCN